MIDELRDVLEKQIAEFKQVVNDQFGVLQRQQNVFLQFVLEYAMSSAQVNDVSIRYIIVFVLRHFFLAHRVIISSQSILKFFSQRIKKIKLFKRSRIESRT